MSLQQRIAKLEMKITPRAGSDGDVGIYLSPREVAGMLAEGARLGNSEDPADMLYLRKIDKLLYAHSVFVKRHPNTFRPMRPEVAAVALARAAARDGDEGEVEYIQNRVLELFLEMEKAHDESCAKN